MSDDQSITKSSLGSDNGYRGNECYIWQMNTIKIYKSASQKDTSYLFFLT